MQVGTTKDLGLYSKPSDAVHPGALAAGTLLQYNTIKGYLNDKRHLYIMLLGFCEFHENRCSEELNISHK